MACPPQLLQIAAWYSRAPPGPEDLACLAAARQLEQRWGSLVNPLLAKKACSPDENTNDSPQSRQVSDRSWNTPRSSMCGAGGAPVRRRDRHRASQEGSARGAGREARNSCAENTRAVKHRNTVESLSRRLSPGPIRPLSAGGNRGGGTSVGHPCRRACSSPPPSFLPPSRSAPVPPPDRGAAPPRPQPSHRAAP